MFCDFCSKEDGNLKLIRGVNSSNNVCKECYNKMEQRKSVNLF